MLSEMAKRRMAAQLRGQQQEVASVLIAAMRKLKVYELRLKESEITHDYELISFFDDQTKEQVYLIRRKSK